METDTPIDLELRQRAAAKRVAALEVIVKTKPLSLIGAQISIWFALVMLALVGATTYKTHLNPAPYLAAVLIPVIGFIAGWMFRMQRRVEALIQLVVDDRSGVAGPRGLTFVGADRQR